MLYSVYGVHGVYKVHGVYRAYGIYRVEHFEVFRFLELRSEDFRFRG